MNAKIKINELFYPVEKIILNESDSNYLDTYNNLILNATKITDDFDIINQDSIENERANNRIFNINSILFKNILSFFFVLSLALVPQALFFGILLLIIPFSSGSTGSAEIFSIFLGVPGFLISILGFSICTFLPWWLYRKSNKSLSSLLTKCVMLFLIAVLSGKFFSLIKDSSIWVSLSIFIVIGLILLSLFKGSSPNKSEGESTKFKVLLIETIKKDGSINKEFFKVFD